MGWGTAGRFSGQKKKKTEKTWKNVEGGQRTEWFTGSLNMETPLIPTLW